MQSVFTQKITSLANEAVPYRAAVFQWMGREGYFWDSYKIHIRGCLREIQVDSLYSELIRNQSNLSVKTPCAAARGLPPFGLFLIEFTVHVKKITYSADDYTGPSARRLNPSSAAFLSSTVP